MTKTRNSYLRLRVVKVLVYCMFQHISPVQAQNVYTNSETVYVEVEHIYTIFQQRRHYNYVHV